MSQTPRIGGLRRGRAGQRVDEPVARSTRRPRARGRPRRRARRRIPRTSAAGTRAPTSSAAPSRASESTPSTIGRPSSMCATSCAVASWSELQDRDLRRARGKGGGDPPAHARARLEVLEQRLEVQDDDASLGGHDRAAPVEDLQQGPCARRGSRSPTAPGPSGAPAPGPRGARSGRAAAPPPARPGPARAAAAPRGSAPPRRRSSYSSSVRNTAVCSRIAGSSSIWLLDAAQLSVSSSCRSIQSAKSIANASTEASTTSGMAIPRRRGRAAGAFGRHASMRLPPPCRGKGARRCRRDRRASRRADEEAGTPRVWLACAIAGTNRPALRSRSARGPPDDPWPTALRDARRSRSDRRRSGALPPGARGT